MDDAEWERWMKLTPEQMEAEIEVEMQKLRALYDSMTGPELYAHRRASILRTCLGWRRHIRRGFAPEVSRRYLRGSQVSLLKLRAWRASGHYPGSA